MDTATETAMDTSVIEEVRLTSFKSFRHAVLPLDDLTLIVGRNGSGKSNALDGLWALSCMAHGEDIRDALEGTRDRPSVRGGAMGCAPFGESSFQLGCTVRTGGQRLWLDVKVQTEPEVQVVWERIRNDHAGQDLLATVEPRPGPGDIEANWPGSPTPLAFRAGRSLTTQVLSRVPATAVGRDVHLAAARIMAALRAVFVLDPVPHEMRQYVPRRDLLLRRDARNLSAAVASLLEQPDTGDRLRDALMRLNEQEISTVTTSASDLDDVMLTLKEVFQGREHPVPARVMSDGTLRFLAMLVAVMQAPTVDTMPEHLASEDAFGQTTVVIEELENGLHASQASMLVGLIREEVSRRRVRALATAHSPAILDALTGDEHRSVVVCQRDGQGRSTLARLTDLPNYWRIAAKGSLGRAAAEDMLRWQNDIEVSDPLGDLDRILHGGAS